jgi:hypothetical protein
MVAEFLNERCDVLRRLGRELGDDVLKSRGIAAVASPNDAPPLKDPFCGNVYSGLF